MVIADTTGIKSVMSSLGITEKMIHHYKDNQRDFVYMHCRCPIGKSLLGFGGDFDHSIAIFIFIV